MSVNQTPVRSAAQMLLEVAKLKPRETANLKLWRVGKILRLDVMIAERPFDIAK